MKDPKSFIGGYVKCAGDLPQNGGPFKVSHVLESRTRNSDITDALRFKVYDPLWLLSRQWQLGEFKGNDAGTAMSVTCQVRTTNMKKYGYGENNSNVINTPNEVPLEPIVEQVNRDITPIVRVESATYFLDLLRSEKEPSQIKAIVGKLRELYPIDEQDLHMPVSSLENKTVETFAESRNYRLANFRAAYASKSFDGYSLFKNPSLLKKSPEIKVSDELLDRYIEWFAQRYMPNTVQGSAWEERKLGYEFSAENDKFQYQAKDYTGGRVSWYSFDLDKCKDKDAPMEKEVINALPTLATYPGSPNKRLWEFENRKVFMGNSTEMQAQGNVAFLQYATMYGNDWMICPLQTEIGKYIEVEKIDVRDTFGRKYEILSRAGSEASKEVPFGQRWQMYTNAPSGTYKGSDSDGFMFPPSLDRTIEGDPLEEVDILRDEMANMVWGVESKIQDGCGSSLDAGLLASEVGQFIDDANEDAVKKATLSIKEQDNNEELGYSTATLESDRKTDFKYKVMTSVPLNWIPLIPQHVGGESDYKGFLGGRETILRRGKLPCFFADENKKDYYPVRPLSSIMRKGLTKDKDGNTVEGPLFIEEEQVQGVGTKLIKNCQRSRWLGGKTYTWMSYSKQNKHSQGVSGLEFDALKEPEK